MGYKFVGESADDLSGYSVSSAGDVDGDGNADLLIGAPFSDYFFGGSNNEGATYLINADDLATLDAADGNSDGAIDLGYVAATGASYKFYGESTTDYSGWSVSSAGDVDGDGNGDLLIGAFAIGSHAGATYLINAADLAALDAADGTTNGVIDLGFVGATGTSYKFGGESASDWSGESVSSAGDVDGDGNADLLIGAPRSDDGTPGDDEGASYLINADDLAALDAADGNSDGVIDLSYVAATGTSYEFVGESTSDQSGLTVSSAGDVDGDGKDDLLIGAYLADDGPPGDDEGSTYLINADDLAALDAADGNTDGLIDLGYVAATGTSYEFVGESGDDNSGIIVSSAGDVDGNGNADLLIGAPGADDGTPGDNEGSTYLINAAELAALDAADGTTDGVIDLGNVQCFLAGTLIATPGGETPVEALRIGDVLRTADGRAVPVKWVARQTIATRFYRERAEPVRIRAGAFGAGLPHRDLTVTADHGMILDGMVINASALVNGSTIHFVPYQKLPARFTVYHIETEAHDVILANGEASETYLDMPDRQGFDNYQEYLDLYGAEHRVKESPMPRIASQRLLPRDIRLALDPETDCAATG